MDPISALSFAANIAQFVDLGASVLQKTREISQAGATVDTLHLIHLSEDIEKASTSLTSSQDVLPLRAVSSEKKALHDLAKRCADTATELSECLRRITSSASRGSVWPSARAALKTIWKKDRIDALAQRLNDFRAQLSLRILLVLNQQQHRQHHTLSNFGENLRNEIVEVVAITCEDLRTSIAQQQYETITAILTTKDVGQRRSVYFLGYILYDKTLPDIENKGVTEDKGNNQEGHYEPLTTRGLVDYNRKVLDALHFREIRERHLSIQEEHQMTFNWAWERERLPRDSASWYPLSEWLAAETSSSGSCYWISGKAGSGKSSLMKYIQKDARTMTHLREWAGTADIIVASFFFWYAGTPLQKSQNGLLQSLLFDILSARPHLVPIAFPDICRSIISGKLVGNIEVSPTELKTAFTKLTRAMPSDLRLFLLIDGIDEYTGDPNEICDLLLNVAKEPSAKILLSSRPISACVHRFEDCPQLRLEDLTRNDIRAYVSDHLCDYSLMKKMEKAQSGITANLAQKIVNRASGIFLWVVLMVRNLQIGLQDYRYDTTTDMMEEVDKLPPDLEKLYSHMIGNMSHSDRVSASKLFQIVLRDFELQTIHPLTVLQLSFCESEDYTDCLQAPVVKPEDEIIRWRCERTEGRLRKRSCGLIEVDHSASPARPSHNPIRFLHRTVVEFLQLDLIWDKIVCLTHDGPFDAELALMSSCVAETKTLRAGFAFLGDWSRLADQAVKMVSYERGISDSSKEAFHKIYLPAMRDVLGHKFHDPNLFDSPEEEVRAINISAKTGSERLGLGFPQSLFLSLSLQESTKFMIRFICVSLGLGMEAIQVAAACLIIHFTEEPQGRLRLAMAKKIETMNLELEICINPKSPRIRQLWNHRWNHAPKDSMERGCSIGEYVLHYCYSIMNDAEGSKFDFTDAVLVESLLQLISREVVGGVFEPYPSIKVLRHGGGGAQYQTIPGCFVLGPLMTKISLRIPTMSSSSTDEITRLLSVIDKELTQGEKEQGIITEELAALGL